VNSRRRAQRLCVSLDEIKLAVRPDLTVFYLKNFFFFFVLLVLSCDLLLTFDTDHHKITVLSCLVILDLKDGRIADPSSPLGTVSCSGSGGNLTTTLCLQKCVTLLLW